jgi:hypothetical protein
MTEDRAGLLAALLVERFGPDARLIRGEEMTDTPDIDLTALTALEQAATPAPWRVDFAFTDGTHEISHEDILVAYSSGTRANAQLIATMRNRLPALLSALTAARAELDEFKAALLEIGEKVDRANGYEPQNRVTVELSSALDRLIRERDSLARRCAVRFSETEAARGEADKLRAELLAANIRADNAAISRDRLRRDMAELTRWADGEQREDVPADEILDVLKQRHWEDVAPAAAPQPAVQECDWRDTCATCGQPIRYLDTYLNGGFWKHEIQPADEHDAEPVVPASVDAGLHETNGFYRERAAAPQPDDLDTHLAEQMADPTFAAAYRAREQDTAGAGDGEQDPPCALCGHPWSWHDSTRHGTTGCGCGGCRRDGEQGTATTERVLPMECQPQQLGWPHNAHEERKFGALFTCPGSRPAPASVQGAADGEAQA